MASPVSIALVPVPAPPTVSVAQNFNQLMQNIAAYMAASVATGGQFFTEGPTDPTTDIGLFFNTAQNVWKYFDASTGNYQPAGFLFVSTDPSTNEGYIYNTTSNQFKNWNGTAYEPLTEFVPGDEKLTYNSGDELVDGWFLQDGRAISSIVGATTEQLAALNALFPSGNLPVGSYSFAPNPSLGDVRWSSTFTDNLSLGWIFAQGQFTAGYPGASSQQQTNLSALYGAQVPFIPQLVSGQPSATGGYAGVPAQLGDVKSSYITGDDLSNGWVVLNGRTISAIAGITTVQVTNATAIYGGAALPTVAATGSPSRFTLGFIGFAFAPIVLYPQLFIGLPSNNPAQYFKVFAGYQTTL